MALPRIDPSEIRKVGEYVKKALVGAGRTASNQGQAETSGRYAAAAGIAAYRALYEASGQAAIAKPGNPNWREDPKAVEAVEYLIEIGFNYEDFLRADIEGASHGD